MNTSTRQLLFDTDTLQKIYLGSFKLNVPVNDNEYQQYDTINNIINLDNNDNTLSSKRKYINLNDVLYNRTEFEKVINCQFNYFTFSEPFTSEEEMSLAQADAAMYGEQNLISDTLYCSDKLTGETVYLQAVEGDPITTTNCLLSPNKTAIAMIQQDGNFCIYMNPDTTRPVINDDYTFPDIDNKGICIWNAGYSGNLIDTQQIGSEYNGFVDIYGNYFCAYYDKTNQKYIYKRKDVNKSINKNTTVPVKFENHRPFVYIRRQTDAARNGALCIGRNMCSAFGDNGWAISWWTMSNSSSNAAVASAGSYLKLDDNGYLTLYSQDDIQLWSSRD